MGTKESPLDAHLSDEAYFEGKYDSRKKRGLASAKVQRKPSWKGNVLANNRSVSLKSSNDCFVKIRNTLESEPLDRLVKIELDAAQALAEFSRIAHLPSTLDRPCQAAASGLQWFGKRKRSIRISNEARKLEENVDASSINGKGLAPSAHVQFNKEFFSNGRFESKKSFAEKSTKYENSSSAARMDEQEKRFLTESSKGSTPPNSGADSPSSPLPPLQMDCRAIPVGGSSASSAFQKVVPMRPVQTSLPLCIKSEVESMGCAVEKHMKTQPTKVAVKRKTRPRKSLLQTISVKVEEPVGPSPSTLVLQRNRVRPCLDKLNTRCMSHAVAEAEAVPMSVSTPVKAESRQVGSSLSLSKATLTEMEREARRLRRVQANRESARQTIRRKQALCEKLTERAASLTLENESMKKRREELLQEMCTLSSTNRHLKEQLAMESGHSILPESPTASLPFSLPTVQVPMLPHAGTPLQSFFWAFALAQSAAASQALALQSCEIASSMDQYPFSHAKSTTTGLWPPFFSPHPFQSLATQLITPYAAEHPTIVSNLPTSCSSVMTPLAEKEPVACAVESGLISSSGTAAYNGQEDVVSQTALLDQHEPQLGSESGSNSSSGDQSQLSVGAPLSQTTSFVSVSLSSQGNKLPMLEGVIPSAVGSSPACTSGHSSLHLENANMQLTRAGISHAIPSNSSVTGGSIEGPSQSYLFTRRKVSVAAAAAAEARKRRKELTRSKIVQSRPFRLHC